MSLNTAGYLEDHNCGKCFV